MANNCYIVNGRSIDEIDVCRLFGISKKDLFTRVFQFGWDPTLAALAPMCRGTRAERLFEGWKSICRSLNMRIDDDDLFVERLFDNDSPGSLSRCFWIDKWSIANHNDHEKLCVLAQCCSNPNLDCFCHNLRVNRGNAIATMAMWIHGFYRSFGIKMCNGTEPRHYDLARFRAYQDEPGSFFPGVAIDDILKEADSQEAPGSGFYEGRGGARSNYSFLLAVALTRKRLRKKFKIMIIEGLVVPDQSPDLDGDDPLELMRHQVHRHIDRGYKTVKQFCHDKKLSEATISNFLGGKKDFQASTLLKIANALDRPLVIRLLGREPRLPMEPDAKKRVKDGIASAKKRGTPVGRPRVAVDIEQAKRLQAEGKGLRTIANQLGIGASTLSRAFQEDGHDVVWTTGRPRMSIDMQRVRKLLDQGEGFEAVAKELGVGKTTLYRALKGT